MLQNEEKFVICRSLDAEGKEEYFVDFKSVSRKLYQNILLRKGINCNAPNYAIWQGEIDKLVFKSPNELTNLIENISGSIYFKRPYEEVKEKLRIIQSSIEEKSRKINKLKTDRKNAQAVKQTSDEYNKWDAQYQEVIKKIYYLHILEKERSIEDLVEEVNKAQSSEKRRVDEINELKLNAQKDLLKKQELSQ